MFRMTKTVLTRIWAIFLERKGQFFVVCMHAYTKKRSFLTTIT